MELHSLWFYAISTTSTTLRSLGLSSLKLIDYFFRCLPPSRFPFSLPRNISFSRQFLLILLQENLSYRVVTTLIIALLTAANSKILSFFILAVHGLQNKLLRVRNYISADTKGCLNFLTSVPIYKSFLK